jgi:dTDP-4-dehydrorhamnose reductase
MRVLITGAAGLVGSHIAKRLASDHPVIALDHSELDITDRTAVMQCVTNVAPALVINCAVMQVDDAEKNPGKAQAVNARGPGFLAEAAARWGAEMLHFSTQYAFPGEPPGRPPYTVDDELCPVNVYGRSKIAGEQAVRDACPKSFIIRTSWVYGPGKESFLCTVHRDLKAGRRVRVIDDIWSSTTYVEDLIARVLKIHAAGHYGTYHVVNEGVCSYYDFAIEAGRLAGLTRDRIDALLEIAKEADMKRAAARPRYTPLRCLLSERLGFAPMRPWQEALAAYIQKSLGDAQ